MTRLPDSDPEDSCRQAENDLLRAALSQLFALVDWNEASSSEGGEVTDPPIVDRSTSDAEVADLIEQCCAHLSADKKSLEERFELFSNNIAAALMIEDESGNILYYSPFSAVLTGYALDELPDSSLAFFERLVVAEDVDKLLRGREVGKLGEDIKIEYQVRHPTGMRFWWESHIVPIYDDADGSVQGLMWVSYDVSHYVRSRQELQERNQDINDFTYMVSHDLKAPIYTIKGMSAALATDHGSQLGTEGLDLLSYITQAAKQMELLVASVVEYSNLSNLRKLDEEVQIEDVLQDAIRDLAGMIKDRSAEIVVSSRLPWVVGERMRIYQVFSNLIGNAIKYSSTTRSPVIRISAQDQQDLNIVIVEDNGIGIPEASLDKIFRPFQRAHSTMTEGSGIGLACVSKIVKQLGGAIKVESKVDVGSKFVLSFPTPKRRRQELAHQQGYLGG